MIPLQDYNHTRPEQSLPPPLAKVVDPSFLVKELKELKARKAVIDKEVSLIKAKTNHKQLVSDIKNKKSELYEYMTEKNIADYQGIKAKSLIPAENKLQEKYEKKAKAISSVLEPVISLGDKDLQNITAQILDVI